MKKFMRKTIAVFIVLLISISCFAACGGNDTEGNATNKHASSATVKPSATPTTEPTATPESAADNRQPAIDAFNKAVTAYDALADKINANSEIYPNYVVELMATMEAPLTNCKAILESNTALADENVQELVSMHRPGEEMLVTVIREGARSDIIVKL